MLLRTKKHNEIFQKNQIILMKEKTLIKEHWFKRVIIINNYFASDVEVFIINEV